MTRPISRPKTNRKIQLPTVLPEHLRVAVIATAAAERRSVSQMVAVLIEEALDARDAAPLTDRIVVIPFEVPDAASRPPRTMTFLSVDVRERVIAIAEQETRTLTLISSILVHEAMDARRRAAARKSA